MSRKIALKFCQTKTVDVGKFNGNFYTKKVDIGWARVSNRLGAERNHAVSGPGSVFQVIDPDPAETCKRNPEPGLT